mmetsp:Transcript_18772/g.54281  ORF Transcript_18772/g.54281 Transcript_18772/m.54281 type:complete len:327 (+) Transcript_18772:2358-3338(+)
MAAAAAEYPNQEALPRVDEDDVVVGGHREQVARVRVSHVAGVLQREVEQHPRGLLRRDVENAQCILQDDRNLEAEGMHGHALGPLKGRCPDGHLGVERKRLIHGIVRRVRPDLELHVAPAARGDDPPRGAGRHAYDRPRVRAHGHNRLKELKLSGARQVCLAHREDRQGPHPLLVVRGGRDRRLRAAHAPAPRDLAGNLRGVVGIVLLRVGEDGEVRVLATRAHAPEERVLAGHAEGPERLHLALGVHLEDAEVTLVAAHDEALTPRRQGDQADARGLGGRGRVLRTHHLREQPGLLALDRLLTLALVLRDDGADIDVLLHLAVLE